MMTANQSWFDIVRLIYTNKPTKDKSLGQRVQVLTELIGPSCPIRNITTEDINCIVSTLKERKLSGSTINRYLSIVSKVLTHYRRHYDPSFNVYIPWQKEGSGRFEWLNSEDEAKVISYLESKGQNDLALVVRLLTLTGMRLGELLSLELDQIEDGWIRLWETKTNRPRSVPVPASISDQLRQLIARGMLRDHQIRRGLSGALRACGIKANITPHSLRHTTATRLIKQGVNTMVVQRYMGHSSIKTTQRYVHIEDGDIRRAMETIVT